MNEPRKWIPDFDPCNINLWYAFINSDEDSSFRDAVLPFLSPDEREQCLRFRFQRLQNEYVVAHFMLRSVLSLYSDVPPAQWTFDKEQGGKPFLVSGQTALPLQFNLSHCNGMAVCGVAQHFQIGVDVENNGREIDFDSVMPSCFHESEILHINREREEKRRSVFFDYWTVKEAVAKAMGCGLAISFDKIVVELNDPGPATVRIEEPGRLDTDVRVDRFQVDGWQIASAVIHDSPRHPQTILRRFDLDCFIALHSQ